MAKAKHAILSDILKSKGWEVIHCKYTWFKKRGSMPSHTQWRVKAKFEGILREFIFEDFEDAQTKISKFSETEHIKRLNKLKAIANG